ncbi:hypothetical protein [Shimia sp. SDUM112013]|uniref:hypothetical protein n=1 Tax=Shimia sp. SDUM112013 TaxID=3136160 RepID=UPI0032EE0F07
MSELPKFLSYDDKKASAFFAMLGPAKKRIQMFRIFRWTSKSLLTLLLLASLTLNIATVTISGVYTAVSSAASAVGLSTVAAREASQKIASRKASREVVRKTSKRVSSRMAKSGARNVATSVGEAIPLVGVAVIAGGLALEVQDACDTARDMAGLEGALDNPDDPAAGQRQAMQSFNCADLIPDVEDLPTTKELWAGMLSAPGKAWSAASGYIEDLPAIDISGRSERALIYAGQRLEYLGNLIWGSEE